MDDELCAIEAIYSEPGLFRKIAGDSESTIISVTVSSGHYEMTVTFSLSPSYPKEAPAMSVASPQLTRQATDRIKSALTKEAENLLDRPMILDLLLWVQENAEKYIMEANSIKQTSQTEHQCGNTEPGSPDCETSQTVLLHLDHMRSKAKYTKLIQKWTEELMITGRLLFQGRLIFILLQGTAASIKEYISRHRTQNVDVDGKGRSCKERMMSILCQLPTTDSQQRFSEFIVEELSNFQSLETLFCKYGMQSILNDHVKPIINH